MKTTALTFAPTSDVTLRECFAVGARSENTGIGIPLRIFFPLLSQPEYHVLAVPGLCYSEELFYPWASALAAYGIETAVMAYDPMRSPKEKTLARCANDIASAVAHLGHSPLVILAPSAPALAIRLLTPEQKGKHTWVIALNPSLTQGFRMSRQVEWRLIRYMLRMKLGLPVEITRNHLVRFFLNDTPPETQANVLPLFRSDSGKLLNEIAARKIRAGGKTRPDVIISAEDDLINPTHAHEQMARIDGAVFIRVPGNHMSICAPTASEIFMTVREDIMRLGKILRR